VTPAFTLRGDDEDGSVRVVDSHGVEMPLAAAATTTLRDEITHSPAETEAFGERFGKRLRVVTWSF